MMIKKLTLHIYGAFFAALVVLSGCYTAEPVTRTSRIYTQVSKPKFIDDISIGGAKKSTTPSETATTEAETEENEMAVTKRDLVPANDKIVIGEENPSTTVETVNEVVAKPDSKIKVELLASDDKPKGNPRYLGTSTINTMPVNMPAANTVTTKAAVVPAIKPKKEDLSSNTPKAPIEKPAASKDIAQKKGPYVKPKRDIINRMPLYGNLQQIPTDPFAYVDVYRINSIDLKKLLKNSSHPSTALTKNFFTKGVIIVTQDPAKTPEIKKPITSSVTPVDAYTVRTEKVYNPKTRTMEETIIYTKPGKNDNCTIKLPGDKVSSACKKPNDVDASSMEMENWQIKFSGILCSSPQSITNFALYKFIDEWYGVDYRLGGCTKDGIDCSAFVQKLYEAVFGITMLRTAFEQFKDCDMKKDLNELKEGDLVFFKIHSRKRITHVGIYLMNSFFVHASASQGIVISSLKDHYWKKYFAGAGEMIKYGFTSN